MIATRVVIAGGGVAALEAALALRALAEARVAIELVGPEPHFWYRPLSVAEPFELGEAHRYELAALASAAGATFTLGALEGVDVGGHEAKTSVGDIPYGVLLVAIGAVPVAAVPGALTFRGPADTDEVRRLLDEIAAGEVRRVAFVVPSGATWSLPLYELALMTAAWVGAHQIQGVELVLVTPEERPLQLFGPVGSVAVRDLLDERGIELVTSADAREFVDGQLRLVPDGAIQVDLAVALPRLHGPRLDGLPQTLDGFIPIDSHGRISGIADVYAAGDITTFPVKQGGIATQLADAAAEMIAAQLGAELRPEPFRPVLRGLLLTGGRPRYLRHELSGAGQGDAASPDPLWWPPAKLVGRHLAPFLAAYAGQESPPESTTEPDALEVEVDLSAATLEESARPPHGLLDDDMVGAVMSAGTLVVAPDDPLGRVAVQMRNQKTGFCAVAEDDRLIGVLTARDVLLAFAAGVHPTEARVREWMTAEPLAVSVSTGVAAAAALMDRRGIHRLPVVDDGRPVGSIRLRDAERHLRGRGIGLGF